MHMKWPFDMKYLKESWNYEKMSKDLNLYMKANNFKMADIDYIFTMLNVFCLMNKPWEEFIKEDIDLNKD